MSVAEWFNPSSSFLLLFCPGQWEDIWRLHCKSRTPAPAPIRLISLSLPFTSYPPLRCLSSHLPRSHASTLSTSPRLPPSYMSQFPHLSHTEVCTLSILSHIFHCFFGVSCNPINPGNLAGSLHVSRLLQWNLPRDVYSETDPRQRNKCQQRNLLSVSKI